MNLSGKLCRSSTGQPNFSSKFMLLHDLILARAKDLPGKTALRRGRESIDFQGLADAVRQVAGGLAALGLEPGDRIGIYLNKRVEAVVS